MADIVVTLPQSEDWSSYERELAAVRDGSSEMHFKVPNLPDVSVGDRCYVVHRGHVKGWMAVTGTRAGGFNCSTTGRRWGGNFVSRSGEFTAVKPPVPMKGFQGFRYVRGTPLSEQTFVASEHEWEDTLGNLTANEPAALPASRGGGGDPRAIFDGTQEGGTGAVGTITFGRTGGRPAATLAEAASSALAMGGPLAEAAVALAEVAAADSGTIYAEGDLGALVAQSPRLAALGISLELNTFTEAAEAAGLTCGEAGALIEAAAAALAVDGPDAGYGEVALEEYGSLISWARRMYTGMDSAALAEVRTKVREGVKTAYERNRLILRIGKLIGEAEAIRNGTKESRDHRSFMTTPLAVMRDKNQRSGNIGRYISALERVREEVRSARPTRAR
jgi:hypothetical protein